MKLLGNLLLACVVLAAIKVAVTGLLIAAALGGIVCLLQRPRETLAIVAVLASTVAFVAHPGVMVASACAIICFSHITDRR